MRYTVHDQITVDAIKRKYGNGWQYMSVDAQTNAVARECMMQILSQVDSEVDVQIVRDIYKAVIRGTGIEE